MKWFKSETMFNKVCVVFDTKTALNILKKCNINMSEEELKSSEGKCFGFSSNDKYIFTQIIYLNMEACRSINYIHSILVHEAVHCYHIVLKQMGEDVIPDGEIMLYYVQALTLYLFEELDKFLNIEDYIIEN